MHREFLPQDIIIVKRDGGRVADAAMAQFVSGIADGSIGDAQVGAFAMAVFLNGLDAAEQVCLTLAMRDSGRVLRWDPQVFQGRVVDKHSTGGVGDKVSFLLAPLLAALGAYVPMISGRGLGHTGGTVDKLESIPGYCTALATDRLQEIVRRVGCAIVGQSDDIAPADRRLYSIRDVTGTVESIPLIVASILSKKLAAGLDHLVLDVKFGNGAMMTDRDDARTLARALARVATGAGVPTTCALTDMNEVLGWTAGNALEIREVIDFLLGAAMEPRLRHVTLELASSILVSCGIAASADDGHRRCMDALACGAAAERFADMVSAQGGPEDLLQHPDRYLPGAEFVFEVPAPSGGVVSGMDTRAIGQALVSIGAGRTHPGEAVDPRVGISAMQRIGTAVDTGDPLCVVHTRDRDSADFMIDELQRRIRVSDAAPEATPVVAGFL